MNGVTEYLKGKAENLQAELDYEDRMLLERLKGIVDFAEKSCSKSWINDVELLAQVVARRRAIEMKKSALDEALAVLDMAEAFSE